MEAASFKQTCMDKLDQDNMLQVVKALDECHLEELILCQIK